MASDAPRHRTGLSISSISRQSSSNDSENAVESSTDVVHPHENPLEDEAHQARQKLPWWKRPAPWWMMALAPLSSLILGAQVGPQVELYTTLACRVHKPDYEVEPLTRVGTYSLHPHGFSDLSPSFNILVNGAIDDTLFKRTFSMNTTQPNPCSSDPAVQAAVAKFTTVINTLMGILTFVTVGWWGSFSDRYGRKKMMGIAVVGQLISSLNILFVVKYVRKIPGGYWLLVVDAGIAGALGGGIVSENAAMFAYISDVSTPEKRSRVFSVVAGFLLAGIGVGPILGSLIVRVTHNIISVFYMAAAFRIVQTCFIWFLIPESLPAAQMQRALAKHQEISISTHNRTPSFYVQRLFFFLKPLSVLLPEKISIEHSSRGWRRDWNLPILILAYGLMLLASASLFNQLLYAAYTFGWGSEYLGYYLSSIGITRAVYLTGILPFIIRFVKSRDNNTGNLSPESEPLLSDENATPRPAPPNTHASAFDLGLARFSMVVDIATFAAMPFAPTGALFILFAMLGSFGASLGPSINSVALDIYSRRFGKNEPVESGKLFGALSVVQSMFGQILGLPMYGLIYAATVATFPRTIFFVALGISVVAFALLNCVRLRPEVRDSDEVEDLS
ncbi:major facilitator superfamily domain-containing protein [Mycena vulgaris]|nr:major facilitator superfamily domain-containing protein [Mycena vulgaris]